MKKQRPEVFFSILILVFGIILLLITPVGANYDEDTYMARIWEMGLGHIIPNSYLSQDANFPNGFITISYRRQVNLPVVGIEDMKRQVLQKIEWGDTVAIKTRAVYFPTLFVIQAVLMRFFGTFLNLPIAILYYIMRFSYLIMYCLLAYFTIRLVPYGKWAFGTLIIAPMCLIQAASVSSDSIIFGIVFLFIAWIVRLTIHSKDNLTKKELLITCLLILAVGTLKPNTILLLPLLFIIPTHVYRKNRYWIPLSLSVLASITISLGWSFLASKFFISRENSGIDPIAQFLSIFNNPLFFIKNLWFMVSGNLHSFYQQAVGISGYGYWYMPKIIYWLFPASLILALFSEHNKVNFTIKHRVLFGLIGLFNIIMVFVIFFVVETPKGYHGIWGVQGRYFTLFFPLLIIPFIFTPRVTLNKMIIGSLVTLTSLISVTSLFLSYHVVCGYAAATNQPCILPYYKNFDPSTFLGIKLDKDTTIKQSMVITCKQLTGIQVWVKENNSSAGQKERFTLKVDENGPLRTSWIDSDGLPQNGWITIPIDPPVSSLNAEFQFELNPDDGIGIPGLELGRFPTNEFNRGSLLINGKETDKDLVFKYSCADNYSTLFK